MGRIPSRRRPSSGGHKDGGRTGSSKGSGTAAAGRSSGAPENRAPWRSPPRPDSLREKAWRADRDLGDRTDPVALRARLLPAPSPHPPDAGFGDRDGPTRRLYWPGFSEGGAAATGAKGSAAAAVAHALDQATLNGVRGAAPASLPAPAPAPVPARRVAPVAAPESFAARGPDGLPEVPSGPGQWRDDPRLERLPAAATHLALGWQAMHPEQRVRAYFLDPNTGILNERAFLALPPDPHRRLVARVGINGAKGLNDSMGHEALDALLRLLAQHLAPGHPTLAKMGGDLVFRVASQAELDAALMKIRASPEWDQRFRVTGAVGGTVEAADIQHRQLKDELRRKGEIGDRGDLPPAFAGLDPQAKAAALEDAARRFRGVRPVEGFAIPAPLRTAFHQTDQARAAATTYTRERTGLLTEAGWRSIPRREWVASIDLRGLKVLNDVFGPENADRIMDAFGLAISRAGGQRFDFAHLHGDEYACQADSRAELDAFLAALQRLTDALELHVVRPDGTLSILHGVEFAARTGRTYDAADQALNEAKRAGEFAPTRPPEVVIGRRNVAARLARLEPAGNLRQRGAEQRRVDGGQDVRAALEVLRRGAGEGGSSAAHR